MKMRAVHDPASGANDQASRRKSVLALGMALLAAGAASTGVTEAKKSKGCQAKQAERCSNDAAACRSQVAAFCSGGGDQATCLAVQNCCDACSADGFLTCYAEVVTV